MIKNSPVQRGDGEGYISLSFMKDKDFNFFLEELLGDLGLIYHPSRDMEGDYVNPEELFDLLHFYKNDRFHVEVFYGHELVTLIIRCSEKDKELIRKSLEAHAPP